MEAKKKINKGVLAAGICAGVIVVVAVIIIVKSFVGSSSISIVPGEPLDYEAKGYIKLGNYKGIDVSVAVTDADVTEEIDNIISDAEEYEHKEGTPVMGDMVNVDIKCSLDGAVLEDWTVEGDMVTIGDEDYFAEIDTALPTMKTGDTKSVTIAVPSDFGDEVIDGKTLECELKLNYICGAEIKPELTDEFVTNYTEGECTSVDDFDEYIKNSLYKDNVDYLAETVWEKVTENVEVKKYNKVEVDNASDETIKSYENFAEMSGVSTEELLDSFGMTMEDVDDVARETAVERMTAKTIAAKENLTMDDASYKELLIENMEYEDSSYKNKTLEEIENDYFESFSEDPKESMLLEFVKNYVADQANVSGLQ